MHRCAKLLLLMIGTALLIAPSAMARVFVPPELHFGSIKKGRQSPPLSATYSVETAEVFRGVQISIAGDYTFTHNCPAFLPPGPQQCTLRVTFAPRKYGFRPGLITI